TCPSPAGSPPSRRLDQEVRCAFLTGAGQVIPCDTNKVQGINRNQNLNYAATPVTGQASENYRHRPQRHRELWAHLR
ncbi:MAG TPA: hypothetical protein VM782_14510, partial [Stellaceae bacterium]|nr:hypothetical protein [Stellaceae bacterium]